MMQPHTSHVTQLKSNALANNKLSCISKLLNQAHLPVEEICNTGVLMTPEQQTERGVLEWRIIIGGCDITNQCYMPELCPMAWKLET